MKYTLKKTFEKILLYCNNNIVTNMNEEFSNFTGYTKEEIIGKSLTEVSCMLKIDSQIHLENIEDKNDCYIFTKEYKPREVTISCKLSEAENEKIYSFKEKLNSRIENRIMYVEQIYKDNQMGVAVYSFPEFVLLRANDKYLETYYPYCNEKTAIGKIIKELDTEKHLSGFDRHFFDVINSGKSYYGKELEYKYPSGETKYHDISLVPILINGKAKYAVQTLVDVTERVLNRKLAGEKTKQLEVILQNISDGVLICDKEGKSIIANNVIREVYPKDGLNEVADISIYGRCFDLNGSEIPFENFPISRALKGEKIKNERLLAYIGSNKIMLQCNATPIYDADGNITGGAVLCNNITELYNKEKVIIGQKEELEAIIENMYDGVLVVDKDFNIITANRSIREFFCDCGELKKAGDALKTTKYYDLEGNLITYDDMPIIRVLRGEKVKDFRVAAYRADGVYYLSYNGSPICDKNGAISKVIISIRDITEQVKKDQLIKKQNDTLNAIIENISDEIVIADKNGQYIMINKAFRNRFSISASYPLIKDIVMKNTRRYDADGNLLAFENFPTQRLARGEGFSQYRIDYKYENGCIIHSEMTGTPIYDSEGNFIAGVLVGRNIDERLKSEENKLMEAQYEILRTTIENLQLNYAIISYPDGKIKYINRNAFNYLKKVNSQLESIDSCIGKNSYEIFRLNMNEKAEIELMLKETMTNNKGHFILNRKSFIDGKESFKKVMCQPLYNQNNEITELVTIQIDITEEMEAKNKMEETLKLQDEIFTNAAHELKTPLNVIFSTIQLMEVYSKNGCLEANREKTSNFISVIKQNCYRFMRIINNIVDTSKIESGFLKLSLSNENIVEVVENIVQSVSEYIKGKGINIIFDTDTEEKIIACDTNKIERIMLNLISNAVKFSDSDSSIYVAISDKNDTVEISVRDNGIGIDNKYLNRIFDRFFQVDKSLSRNAEGQGIGLDLVKSFVEMHGGKISVESEVGKGSVFKIELPAETLEEDEIACDKVMPTDNRVQMIGIEFSDIYSI